MRGKGELIVGAATAVRRDHVLVGTTAGVASRIVPFDYLVVNLTHHTLTLTPNPSPSTVTVTVTITLSLCQVM